MMKRISSVLVFALLLLVVLAGCGGGNNSSSSPAAPSGGASVSIEEGAHNVAALADTFAQAAGLENTIDLSLTDLTASGDVNAANILEMVGYQSVSYADDGGMVVVVRAQAGSAETVYTELQAYLAALINQGEDYQSDYPEAYEHMTNARFTTNGDYVVMLVSATGDYDALDEAFATTFV